MKLHWRLPSLLACGLTMVISCRSTLLAQDDYQKWQKEQQAELETFKEQRDKDFVGFLQNEWRMTPITKGEVPDAKPKPANLPVLKPEQVSPTERTQSSPIVSASITPPPTQTQKDLPAPPRIDERNGELLRFHFFGVACSVRFDPVMRTKISNEVNEKSISAFWSTLSRSGYEELLKQMQYHRELMALNDWGFSQFVYSIGIVYSNNPPMKRSSSFGSFSRNRDTTQKWDTPMAR